MTTLCICDIAGLLGEKLPDWAASLPARTESFKRSANQVERDGQRKSAPARMTDTACRSAEYEPVPI